MSSSPEIPSIDEIRKVVRYLDQHRMYFSESQNRELFIRSWHKQTAEVLSPLRGFAESQQLNRPAQGAFERWDQVIEPPLSLAIEAIDQLARDLDQGVYATQAKEHASERGRKITPQARMRRAWYIEQKEKGLSYTEIVEQQLIDHAEWDSISADGVRMAINRENDLRVKEVARHTTSGNDVTKMLNNAYFRLKAAVEIAEDQPTWLNRGTQAKANRT